MVTKTIKIVVDASQAQTELSGVKTGVEEAKQTTESLRGTLDSMTGGAVSGFARMATGIKSAVMGFRTLAGAIAMTGIGLLVVAIGLLVAAFKDFTPLIDRVQQGMAAVGAVINVVLNTVIALVTGTKSLSEAFSGLGDEMSSAASETVKLTKAQQDLEDALEANDTASKRIRAEINKLNVELKNKNLTEEERLKIAAKVEDLENRDFLTKKKLADQAVINARKAIAIAAQLTVKEQEELRKQGLNYKEFVEKRTQNADELFKNLKEAVDNRIGVEDLATTNLEKVYNKQEKLAADREAKAQAAQEKIDAANEKARAKREAARQKRQAEEEAYKKKAQDILTQLEQGIETPAQKEMREYEEKKKILQDNKLSTELLEQEHIKKMIDIDNQYWANESDKRIKAENDKKASDEKILKAELDYWAAESDAAVKKSADDKARADAETARDKAVHDAKVDLANTGLSLIASIAKEGSAIAKATGVAQAIMNSYQAVTSVLAAPTVIPEPLGTPLKIANAVMVGAMGMVNVKKILSVKAGGGGASGSIDAPSGGASAPSFNLVRGTGTSQITDSINGRNQTPIKAYVVSQDMTNQQQLDNSIKTAGVI